MIPPIGNNGPFPKKLDSQDSIFLDLLLFLDQNMFLFPKVIASQWINIV